MSETAEYVSLKNNADLAAYVAARTRPYRKKAVTLGRLVRPEEVGQELVTYVPDKETGGIRKETSNVMSEDQIVSRNPDTIGTDGDHDVYNEWLQGKATWLKNYGELPPSSNGFTPFKKLALIEAAPVDETILEMLGSTDGKTALLGVSWGEGFMEVYLGGYIATAGYGISPADMNSTYEPA